MSVRVLTAVFDNSRAAAGTRMVLLVLADSAHDDGITWISQEEIARKALVTEMTVRTAIQNLVALGELQVMKLQRGQRRINLYRVIAPGLADINERMLPADVAEAFTTANLQEDDRKSAPVTTAKLLPSPYIGNRKDNRKGTAEPSAAAGERITPEEMDHARVILAYFNEKLGTSLQAGAHLRRIVLRLRERPDLTLDDHRAAIDGAARSRWWNGPTSTTVVYGSEEQFERSLADARNPRHGGDAVSPAELSAFGTVWGPGGTYETLEEARAAQAI